MKRQRRNFAVPTFTPFQGAQVSRMPTPRAGQVSLGGMPSAPSGGGQDWFSQLLTQKLAGAVNAGIDNLWDAYVTQGIFGVEPPEVPEMPQGGGGYDLSGWSPQQQAQSYQGATQPQASRPMQEKTLLDFIAGPESGGRYDVAYGGVTMPAGLTVDEAIAWGKQHGQQTGSSAMGRYQFLSRTLSGLKDKMGLSGSEPFSPDLQDAMAVELMRGRGLDKFKAGDISAEQFAANLAKEWAGLPAGSHGRSYYHGDKMGNAAGVGWNDLLAAIRGEREVDTRTASTTPTPGEIPMNSSMMYDTDITEEVRQAIAQRPDLYGGTAFDPAVPEQGRFAEEGPLVTPPAVPAETGAESAPQAQQATQQQPQGQAQSRGWRSLFDTGPGTSGYMMVPGQEAAVPFVRTGPRNQAIPDTSGLPQVGQAQQMAPAPQQMPVGAPQSAPQPQGLPQQPPGPQAPQSGGDGFWANLFGVPQRRRAVAAQQLAMGKTFMDLQEKARQQALTRNVAGAIAQHDPMLASLVETGMIPPGDLATTLGYGVSEADRLGNEKSRIDIENARIKQGAQQVVYERLAQTDPDAAAAFINGDLSQAQVAQLLKLRPPTSDLPTEVKMAEYLYPDDPDAARAHIKRAQFASDSAVIGQAYAVFPGDDPQSERDRAKWIQEEGKRELQKLTLSEGIKLAYKKAEDLTEKETVMREQLNADRDLYADLVSGKFKNNTGLGREYLTKWYDSRVAKLNRYQTETAMRALNVVNVAPVSNFEFNAMSGLSANIHLTPAQNKYILEHVMAVREAQLKTIQLKKEKLAKALADGDGSYMDYLLEPVEIVLPPETQKIVDAYNRTGDLVQAIKEVQNPKEQDFTGFSKGKR